MNALKTLNILAAAVVMSGIAPTVMAEGDPAPTYQREFAMQKYKGCKYTDEMGKYLYECVKKNDGFGTHWCFDESLELYCPKPTAQNNTPAETAPADASKTQ